MTRSPADLDGVAVGQPGACLVEPAAGPFKQVAIDAVEPLDLDVLVGDQPGPVMPGPVNRPAEAGGVLDVVADMGGIGHQLLRHAADIDAGAAEMALLRHRDAGAVAGGDPRRAHPAGAGADDEEVVVVGGHGSRSLASGGGWLVTAP